MLSIKHLETITLNVPFYCDRVSRHMHRAATHGERVYVYRVELSNGVIGYGENLYDESGNIERLVGQNPFACMNDDSVGFGIQMSLYDAVGKTVGVPASGLIGPKVRESCPISWWDIDMPPEDWVAEVQESVKRGYTSAKLKARPWRDIFAQVDAVGNAVPADYKLDIDFNGFLRTADNAIPVLQKLDEHPNVAIYESPFYLGTDIEGAARLQEAVQKRIVEHYNESCLHARCCGGFVVGGSVNSLLRTNALCSSFEQPFWLQMVGTGITTAYCVHLGAVLSQAELPAITCHELWESDLLETRLEVLDGTINVPDLPGLGVSVDEDALAAYRVEKSAPTPQQLFHQTDYTCRVHIPNADGGETIHDFSGEGEYYPAFSEGKYPGFVPGVWMEVV
ncbi:MAG: mandelate racemase/muconate lactonizing enzyme family protein [Candidatus Poribacteria bacterium]|nr:mandelate racemase/muconate lactonizing enzyme family protein [Candidatus Poribacteria bacterium]